MSKKKVILGTLIILTIIITFYGASIVYSVLNISYQTGSITINPAINVSGFPPEYSGQISISTPVSINNKGFYGIKDLRISIKVTTNDWQVSSLLNGIEVASGNNFIGSIIAGESWSGNIDVIITNYIPNFAIEDCTLLIAVSSQLALILSLD